MACTCSCTWQAQALRRQGRDWKRAGGLAAAVDGIRSATATAVVAQMLLLQLYAWPRTAARATRCGSSVKQSCVHCVPCSLP
jgi:hypothetical protein